MKRVIMLLTMIILFSFTSCDPAARPVDKNTEDLFELVKCNIPTPDFGSVGIEIVEQDEYGRILFRYSDSDILFDGSRDKSSSKTDVKAYFICQKRTEKDIYYLENECYLLSQKWDFFTDDVLADFKDRNHWGREMNTDVLTRARLNDYPNVVVISDAEIEKITGLKKAKDGEAGTGWSAEYVHYDSQGRALIFIDIYSRTKSGKYLQSAYQYSYIAISSPSGDFTCDGIVKIDDYHNHKDELVALKEKVGWNPLK